MANVWDQPGYDFNDTYSYEKKKKEDEDNIWKKYNLGFEDVYEGYTPEGERREIPWYEPLTAESNVGEKNFLILKI